MDRDAPGGPTEETCGGADGFAGAGRSLQVFGWVEVMKTSLALGPDSRGVDGGSDLSVAGILCP